MSEKNKDEKVKEQAEKAPASSAVGPENTQGAKEEKQKGNPNQPKSTARNKPSECAGCGKALKKKVWYYRNGKFFCTKRCCVRKSKEGQEKKAE